MKLPLSPRRVLLGMVFLALGASLRSQETPAPAASVPGDAVPPNVMIASGPVSETPKPTEPPRTTPVIRVSEEQINPRFLGAMSCSSSLCHGGGSAERNAYTIWAKSDPHRRAAATLAGTRAERIAQGLPLGSAAGSARCTECHTPLATVPAERLSAGVDAKTEGVSCESCHGPAQNWVRSHTRRDFSHAQNVLSGVREERNLYERAGSCVACHQVLAPDLLAAGHPALFFELDAQMAAEPRHWVDQGDFFGPQAWLTGQAVAWREMSWALSQTGESTPEARAEWSAVCWLLQRTVDACGGELPKPEGTSGASDFSPGNLTRIQGQADNLARVASHFVWTRASTRRCLLGLASAGPEFLPTAGSESPLALRCRAQRVAAAITRLMAPLQKQDTKKWAAAATELDPLFELADGSGAFDGAVFGEQLRRFHDAVAAIGD